jgi:transposase-like protein
MADRISHCAYFFGAPSKTLLLLSISPQILHECARNLNRLGKPKQAHNYNKINGDTEAGQQKDADEAGTMGEFQEALAALLGGYAPNLSPAVICRLTAEWLGEDERWRKRDLSARWYVYVWADGVFLQARMEDHGECMLVLIGATPEGKKELIGFQVGVPESAQSWHELLVEAKSRGLKIAPAVAVGDGALGFWKALDEVFPATRHQRCWVHRTANILNKVALSVQANMNKDLREGYLAPNRTSAELAIDFAEKYAAKHDKAVECPTKDRDTLLALYSFPTEHWDHLRTTNPIESVFGRSGHRTVRAKGSLSSTTAKLMVFKLLCAASSPGGA